MAQSFALAGQQLLQKKPAETATKYPELLQWNATAAKAPGQG